MDGAQVGAWLSTGATTRETIDEQFVMVAVRRVKRHRDTAERRITLRVHPFLMPRLKKAAGTRGMNKLLNDLIEDGLKWRRRNTRVE